MIYYVPLLKQANVTLDLKNATPEERSEQAKQMAAANKQFKGETGTNNSMVKNHLY